MSEVTDTIVLGIGNPLRGDDGIGPAVIDWLRAHDLPREVTAIDGGTTGLELVLTLTGYRRAIIVDATNMDHAPGEWMRFMPDRVQLKSSDLQLSLHNAGLTDALILGAALGTLPEEIIIYGVQPAKLNWTIGLSVKAQLAVPLVGRAILKEAEDHYGKNPDH